MSYTPKNIAQWREMHLMLHCQNLISALCDNWNDKGAIRELQQDLLVVCNNSMRSDQKKGMTWSVILWLKEECFPHSQVLTRVGGPKTEYSASLLVPCPSPSYSAAHPPFPFLVLTFAQLIERARRYMLLLFCPTSTGRRLLCYSGRFFGFFKHCF